jgi:hypothetical protein
MIQQIGIVGGGLRKGQMPLHLPDKPKLTEEREKVDHPIDNSDGFGCFVHHQLGLAEERGNFNAGRFVQSRASCKSINLYTHAPSLIAPFFYRKSV